VLLAGLQALAFAGGVAAYRAGAHEEERVEHRVSEPVLETHEESAERFLWSAGVAFLCSAGVVFMRNPTRARWLAVGSVAASLATAGAGIGAGKSGGAVAYGAGVAAVAAPAALDAAARHERDDD
jgi:hypothetical protein